MSWIVINCVYNTKLQMSCTLSPTVHVSKKCLIYLPVWEVQHCFLRHSQDKNIVTIFTRGWHDTSVFSLLSWGSTHLKDLLTRHLYATVSRLRLLQRQFMAEQLQLVDQVSLIARRHISLSTSPTPTPHFLTPHIHRRGLGGILYLGLLAGGEKYRWDNN